MRSLWAKILARPFTIAVAGLFVIAALGLAYAAHRDPTLHTGVLSLPDPWLYAWSCGIGLGGVGILAGVAWGGSPYMAMMVERSAILLEILVWSGWIAVVWDRSSRFGLAQDTLVVAALVLRLVAIGKLSRAMRRR